MRVHHALPTQMNKPFLTSDEKPHTSILEFWSPKSWLLDDCLPRLREPGTSLHTTQPVTNIQKMLQQASHNCKQMQSYTLSIHFFGFCHANMKHVCIYMFVILFIAWLEKCNLCQRCGRSSEPGRVYWHTEMNESNVALASCSSVNVPHFELTSTPTYLQQHLHASSMVMFFPVVAV